MGSIPVAFVIIYIFIYYIFLISCNILSLIFKYLWFWPYYYLIFLLNCGNIFIIIFFIIWYIIFDFNNIIIFNLEYIFGFHYLFTLFLYASLIFLIILYYINLCVIKAMLETFYFTLFGWIIFISFILGLLWSFQIYQVEYWWSIYDWAENILLFIFIILIVYRHYRLLLSQRQLAGFLIFNMLFILSFIDTTFFFIIHTNATWLNSIIFIGTFTIYYLCLNINNFIHLKFYYNLIGGGRGNNRLNILYIVFLFIFVYLLCFNFNTYIIFIDLLDYNLIYSYIFLNILLLNNKLIFIIIFYVFNITYWFIDLILVFNSLLLLTHLVMFKVLVMLMAVNTYWLGNFSYSFTLYCCFLVIYLILLLTKAEARTFLWGDYELLHFYPRNWQVGYFRSGHSLLVYITMWQYWLWFTFIFLLNIYFVFLFRALTYRRADMRGRRAVGDRRRSAWPEMFTCFFPFLWCINILNNSLGILKVVEADGDYATLTVQVIGFQWGWSYGYGELHYTRLLLNPIKVGFGLLLRPGYTLHEAVESAEVEEIEMCRAWLKSHDALVPFTAGAVKLPMFQFGVWTTVQGTSTSAVAQKYNVDGSLTLINDPLRLLRATEVIAVPTRSNIRLLATAQDVTHSWALPALGLKLDCVPGRLYVSFMNIVREGVYYGQCSELCGWNHYNMPIVLYALAYEHFIIWWELELHAAFCKQSRDSLLSYRTLNFKYK